MKGAPPEDGLWTLSFGLSQFHGHGSWLVCEVALIAGTLLNGSQVKCMATSWPSIVSTQFDSIRYTNLIGQQLMEYM